MSPCSTSACLLVLLGAVLAASGFPRHRRAQHVSEKMTQKQALIAHELGLTQPEVGNIELFSFVNSINTSCQRNNNIELINTTLDVYKRIFSSILAHSNHHHHTQGESTASVGLLDQVSDSKRSEVESAIKSLQDKMEGLKNHLTDMNQHKEKILDRLNEIKVDDLMAQKRALAEYLGVFQAASVIAHTSC
ncbi:unnamed protein product [Oreochromis niloticus]|uniref:Uncharacterized protein n=1 Tax=Oreochromis niloticus TaxID=8128 RepID=A0A669BAT9_ORENI|nr:unnamed protein product [Mustela putorius furo]